MESQRPSYSHRQTGWVMLGIACLPFAWMTALWAIAPVDQRNLPHGLVPGLGVVTVVALIGFSSLTVEVTRHLVVMRFGIGLFRKRIPMDRIASVAIIESRWYEGWGIHWTRRGTLYNVSGFEAVRLELVDGKALMIGTDDPRGLRSAIDRQLDLRRRASTAPR